MTSKTDLPAGAAERLAQFAAWTGTTPPDCVTVGRGPDRTFSDAILRYAAEQGMSLDWWWMGDERGLVMANHCRERQAHAA